MDDKAAVEEELGMSKVCVALALDGGYGVFLVDLNQARLDYGVVSEKSFETRPNLTIPYQAEVRPYIFHVLSGSLIRYMDLISIGAGDDRWNDVDFEIHDPRACESRILPQLNVCRRDGDDDSLALRLYNSAKSEYSEEEFVDRLEERGIRYCTFSIVSYCVDGDDFVVETDFGSKFCLKLDGDGDDGWRLCEEGYVFEPVNRNMEFANRNMVTPNGVCFNAFGANDHRRRWLRSTQPPERRDEKMYNGGEGGRRVCFPVVSIDDDYSRALIETHDCAYAVTPIEDDPRTMCIVRTAFDRPMNYYEFHSKLYWILDVLKLNLEEEFDDDDGEFAKWMMSFKFCVPEEVDRAYVVGLSYYDS